MDAEKETMLAPTYVAARVLFAIAKMEIKWRSSEQSKKRDRIMVTSFLVAEVRKMLGVISLLGQGEVRAELLLIRIQIKLGIV